MPLLPASVMLPTRLAGIDCIVDRHGATPMKEHQHIEWKESWRDEYLKWICGFANAEGGVLVIGRNDRGEIIGVPNAAKLMEDIPNKVRDVRQPALPG